MLGILLIVGVIATSFFSGWQAKSWRRKAHFYRETGNNNESLKDSVDNHQYATIVSGIATIFFAVGAVILLIK